MFSVAIVTMIDEMRKLGDEDRVDQAAAAMPTAAGDGEHGRASRTP